MKSDTRFMAQVRLLSPAQITELSDAMVTAGVGYELKGDWREPFRRLSHRYRVGYAHRVYKMLYTLHDSKIEPLINGVLGVPA